MKLRECIKAVLIILSFWLFLSMGERNTSAEELSGGVGAKVVSGGAITNNIGGKSASDINDGASAEELSGGVGAKAVSGGAITYYIGGEGASDTNDGTSSAKPFATLYKATSTINIKGAGNYEILVQGDTSEKEMSTIGKYNSCVVNVTIKNVSNNVYTINRESNVGYMIYVVDSCTLSLGDQYGENTTNLIIDGNNHIIDEYASIENWGTLNLYNGVSLRNNKSINIRGNAIRNENIFNMYGGEISNNEGMYGGAIFNGNEFNMYGGEISNNEGVYGGAIFNFRSFNMYNGKIFKNNSKYDGGAIYNAGGFGLHNGSISSNTCAGQGGGIYNTGAISIIGGTISDNMAITDAGGVCSIGDFFRMENGSITANSTRTGKTGGVHIDGQGNNQCISGGNISDNIGVGLSIGYCKVDIKGGSITGNTSIGVAVYGFLSLSGDFSIHTNGSLATNIVLQNTTSRIIIEEEITGSEITYVTPFEYNIGREVIQWDYSYTSPSFDPNSISEIYQKFCLSNSKYTINGIGRIVPLGEITYYVGGANASDENDGLDSTRPFKTLEKAAVAISHTNGIIIIQSDLEVRRPIVINGNVTIKSDGYKHRIDRYTYFSTIYKTGKEDLFSMFIVYGKLILGNKDNADVIQKLDVNANCNLSYDEGIKETIYIGTDGEVDLFGGVTLQNNNNGAAIYNKGKFNMHGGIIKFNGRDFAGGIYNCSNGSVTMSGGSIEDNRAFGGNIDGVTYGSGGVFNTGNSTFTMTGGSISENTGYISGGIYNGTNCTFNMMGGKLGQNYEQQYSLGIFNDLGGNFIFGQDADILQGNDIWLVEGSTITFSSLPTVPATCLLITLVKFDPTRKSFIKNYTPGTQVISKLSSCEASIDKLSKSIMIYSDDYGINKQGMIATGLKRKWVSLPNGTEYTYTGSKVTPEVVIVDGTKTLQQNIDYIVSYTNDVSAGLHYIKITGIGNYLWSFDQEYRIKPAIATSVITEIKDETFSANNRYGVNQLMETLPNSVELKYDGGKENVFVNWSLTEGVFNYKGGNYTFTGSLLEGSNIQLGGLTLTKHIKVIPVVPNEITFNHYYVPIGTNRAATVKDLGEDIFPTSGAFSQEGTYDSEHTGIFYTIDWGKETLDTTINKSTTTFIGKVTFVNYPEWLTIPKNVTVSRTVSVTGKMIVDINCDITSKTYDGKPVSLSRPYNEQGYTGRYKIHYVSTNDKKGYSDESAPKNAGDYKCIISLADDLTDYTGSKEIYFTILPKNITIIVDNSTIYLNEPLPTFTYHYKKGDELISGDTFIVKPTLSAPSANTGIESDYPIKIIGADAGDNYKILLVDGVLKVKAPASHSITTSAGANGTINPSGIQSVLHNTDKTFVITPDKNYEVLSVLIDGVDNGSITTYTFHKVTANHSISVTFKAIPTVTPTATPTITPTTPPKSDGGSTPIGGGGFPSGGGGFPSGGGGAPMGGGGAPAGGTPTPTPSVSPTPTLTPNKAENKNTSGKINLIGSDGSASVSMKEDEQKGSVNITVDLSEDEYLTQKDQNGSQTQPHDITLPIRSEQILEQIKKENVKEVNVDITIPKDLQNNKNAGGINSVLGEELLTAAKENGKDIKVSVNDEDGKEQYSWTFTGDNLSKSNQDVKDINLSLDVEAVNKSELKELLSDSDSKRNDSSDQKGLVINFHHHGDLPSQASVRIYIGKQEGIKTGDKVTLYYYNSETNKLESLPNSSGYTVDADGYVTVQILHCSNYVLLTEAPDKSVVTSLIDQINASVTVKTLYFGGASGDTTDYMIKLPSTMEWVSSKKKPSSSAVGAVYITFSSDNPKVAVVDNQGHITAKALGTCTISAKVKLYNGKTKIYKTTIQVKEPYISIVKYKKTMKVGDTFLFESNTHGLKNETIEWSTSEKLILEINSKTGKATAISSGTDYIIAKIGSIEAKVKVVISEK